MNALDLLTPELWTTLAIISGITLVVGAFVTPWLLSLIPQDYFLTRQEYLSSWKKSRPYSRWIILALRNLVGLTLCFLGLVMLVAPGQGLVTILLGLAFTTFPGKRTLELKILSQRSVLTSVNWLRSKMNREPLLLPDPAKEESRQSNEV